MEELVSIVLPIYNGQKYMKESIDSIINQTYKDWELIIMDDCSTDETATIAKMYAENDERIKYYRNESNLRLPGNLNKGFSLAKGKYLTWTSDDNYYSNQAIEKMVNVLRSTNNEFVFASCRIIDKEGKEIEYIIADENSRNSIVGSNPVGACFMYTRKVYESVGDYDVDSILVEDFDYWQRIASRFNFTYIKEILYYYRFHDGALTSTMRKEQFNHNLEVMLKRNVKLFGKLNMDQKYYYYRGLSNCKDNLHEKNPYKLKYNLMKVYYLIRHRIPGKIKRTFKK